MLLKIGSHVTYFQHFFHLIIYLFIFFFLKNKCNLSFINVNTLFHGNPPKQQLYQAVLREKVSFSRLKFLCPFLSFYTSRGLNFSNYQIMKKQHPYNKDFSVLYFIVFVFVQRQKYQSLVNIYLQFDMGITDQ